MSGLMNGETRDPLDELPAHVLAFAEAVFDRFDVWAVVEARAAAVAAKVSVGTAKHNIARLKAARCWPYRSAKWRAQGFAFSTLAA